jgi:hypothetical protein
LPGRGSRRLEKMTVKRVSEEGLVALGDDWETMIR